MHFALEPKPYLEPGDFAEDMANQVVEKAPVLKLFSSSMQDPLEGGLF